VGRLDQRVGTDVEAHARVCGVAGDTQDVEEAAAAHLSTEVADRRRGVRGRELLLGRIDGVIDGDLPGRQTGRRRDDLERRSGEERLAERPWKQRLVLVE